MTTTVTPPAVRAPFWSYKLGLDNGWMPKDPTVADGLCTAMTYDGSLQPYHTGGAGAGTLSPSVVAQYTWPPAQISSTSYTEGALPATPPMLDATALPSYTPTGTVIVLPTPTFFGATKSVDAGNGIFNPQATESMWVPVAGCAYPEVYSGNTAPNPGCGLPAKRTLEAERALVTEAPESA